MERLGMLGSLTSPTDKVQAGFWRTRASSPPSCPLVKRFTIWLPLLRRGR